MIVDFDIRKWDDRSHYRFQSQFLGRDRHGAWLATPAGTPIAGPNGTSPLWYGFVTLVPDDEWWVASWNDERDENHELYVDITTSARWLSEEHLTLVDLDLDVVRERGGAVRLLDEDEFDEHKLRYRYPDDVVARAVRTAQFVLEAVGVRREPFGESAARWLELVG